MHSEFSIFNIEKVRDIQEKPGRLLSIDKEICDVLFFLKNT
jgi:hypothetical protein